ncbi:RNA methyltransferase [soil metagenome]
MLSRKLIKYIQSLSHKKFRDTDNVFIAEGPKIILEFLTSKTFECELICALPQWINNIDKDLLDDIEVHEVDDLMLNRLSALATPNKVLAVFKKRFTDVAPDLDGRLTLMLDDIKDPGNFGSIIRIADWFGLKNVICSSGSVDCYNPKVVQGSMGSLTRVSVIYTDLPLFIRQNSHLKLYAATLTGTSIYNLNGIREGILIIGNESFGVNSSILELATDQISIPRSGQAESLNAAVATGIILSHLGVR